MTIYQVIDESNKKTMGFYVSKKLAIDKIVGERADAMNVENLPSGNTRISGKTFLGFDIVLAVVPVDVAEN